MIDLPLIRWGKNYYSLDRAPLVDVVTGQTVAQVSLAHGGLVRRDLRQAALARQRLCDWSIDDLLAMSVKAADLFLHATLPIGDRLQSPEAFVAAQSSTTGLPQTLCRANMEKLAQVLQQLPEMMASMTRGLDYHILTNGHGPDQGVCRSYQAQTDALSLILPSNSPGVHGLWLPVLAMQMGLVLKPGAQEPWSPYRLYEAMAQAGLPREAVSIYPGCPVVSKALAAKQMAFDQAISASDHSAESAIASEVVSGDGDSVAEASRSGSVSGGGGSGGGVSGGGGVVSTLIQQSQRVMLFGGQNTIEQHQGQSHVQVHGPGYSKILIGEDQIDQWRDFLDVMVASVAANSGRSCLCCSSIWVPRHGRAIAEAIAQRLASIEARPLDDPEAQLAAFVQVEQARAIDQQIQQGMTSEGTTLLSDADRLVDHQTYAYLKPTVVHCQNSDEPLANVEYMFPFVSVVEAPQAAMIPAIGSTLVATAITENADWQKALLQTTVIDRLNIGPVPTVQINWRQPHEGDLLSFLFRTRAVQWHETSGV